VADLSKFADDDRVKWLVHSTGKTRRLHWGTHKVCRYLSPAE
jgi:hypothetical protein